MFKLNQEDSEDIRTFLYENQKEDSLPDFNNICSPIKINPKKSFNKGYYKNEDVIQFFDDFKKGMIIENDDNDNDEEDSINEITLSKSKNEEKNTNNNSSPIKNNETKPKQLYFKIQKVIPKNNNKLSQKRGRRKKSNDIDWQNIIIPKAKHFHFDRDKHRIVFQRKHLKMLYSIIYLKPPFNFEKYFKLIDEHVGDKTKTYNKRKSFHIIKLNGEEVITNIADLRKVIKKEKTEK